MRGGEGGVNRETPTIYRLPKQYTLLKNARQVYALTSLSNGSKAYMAGLRPAAGYTVFSKPFSTNIRANLDATCLGIPLLFVNLLFLKTGCEKIKSSAFTDHCEARRTRKVSRISLYNSRIFSAVSKFVIACASSARRKKIHHSVHSPRADTDLILSMYSFFSAPSTHLCRSVAPILHRISTAVE